MTPEQPAAAYVRFADIYDLAYHFIDYRHAATWIRDAIRTRRSDATTLLEVACGTGRYLELLSKHFDVAGLDHSASMLVKARLRLPKVPFFEADMAGFDLGRRFDVVCCLFRSIGYALTTARLRQTVIAMARHIRPGGLVIIEPFFTPESYWVERVTLNEYRGEGIAIAWMYVSERVGAHARLRIHCLVGKSSGVEHFVEDHEFGLFTSDDFAEAFDAAGLRLEHEPQTPGGTGMYIGWKD